MSQQEVVITGIGVISPIGIGKDHTWDGYCTARNGVDRIQHFDPAALPVRIAAEVTDFDARQYVKPRKNLKVMLRDAQLGVSASVLACRDAKIDRGAVDPERLGVVLGADKISGPTDDSAPAYHCCTVDGKFDYARWGQEGLPAIYPLTFLRVLPNMIASHISILHDARGPNNTIHQSEVSSLLAISEAARVIQRGAADVMLAGGASSTLAPYDWVGHCGTGQLSSRQDDPSTVLRPFDADRDGEVRGEGAAIFILERRWHAETRGATILARVLGCASGYGGNGRGLVHGAGLRRAIGFALEEARLRPSQLDHVNAHGASTVGDDAIEAKMLAEMVPGVPVTAPKSYFGNLGAAGGAVEMVASVMALTEGKVPATRNYERPDPRCPVHVVQGGPRELNTRTALLLNSTRVGQTAAVLLGEAS